MLPLVTLPSEPVAFSFGKHARNLYFVQPKSGAQGMCLPWSLLATSLLVYFCWGKGQISPLEGVLLPKLYVDVPAKPQKLDFLYTNFSHNYPPISIPFLKESTQNTPYLCNLGSFISDENPLIAIPNFAKKRQAHIQVVSKWLVLGYDWVFWFFSICHEPIQILMLIYLK